MGGGLPTHPGRRVHGGLIHGRNPRTATTLALAGVGPRRSESAGRTVPGLSAKVNKYLRRGVRLGFAQETWAVAHRPWRIIREVLHDGDSGAEDNSGPEARARRR